MYQSCWHCLKGWPWDGTHGRRLHHLCHLWRNQVNFCGNAWRNSTQQEVKKMKVVGVGSTPFSRVTKGRGFYMRSQDWIIHAQNLQNDAHIFQLLSIFFERGLQYVAFSSAFLPVSPLLWARTTTFTGTTYVISCSVKKSKLVHLKFKAHISLFFSF